MDFTQKIFVYFVTVEVSLLCDKNIEMKYFHIGGVYTFEVKQNVYLRSFLRNNFIQ